MGKARRKVVRSGTLISMSSDLIHLLDQNLSGFDDHSYRDLMPDFSVA